MTWQVRVKRAAGPLGALSLVRVHDFPTRRAALAFATEAVQPGVRAEVWRWRYDQDTLVAKLPALQNVKV